MQNGRERLVVVGSGMVGHRFLEMLAERTPDAFDVTLIGEEPGWPTTASVCRDSSMASRPR